ncbi:hypothetical protein A0H76_2386 [Hepatospora eriocheir]|uniref:Uncharacterized protein n=1 Tax=Hepatospora eriocheir TaxID=1081669 RepID=A0A1X0QLI9_9MICR|nr:hypothetical protein A0H76_2386 [Hepatospora eriocheir]
MIYNQFPFLGFLNDLEVSESCGKYKNIVTHENEIHIFQNEYFLGIQTEEKMKYEDLKKTLNSKLYSTSCYRVINYDDLKLPKSIFFKCKRSSFNCKDRLFTFLTNLFSIPKNTHSLMSVKDVIEYLNEHFCFYPDVSKYIKYMLFTSKPYDEYDKKVLACSYENKETAEKLKSIEVKNMNIVCLTDAFVELIRIFKNKNFYFAIRNDVYEKIIDFLSEKCFLETDYLESLFK